MKKKDFTVTKTEEVKLNFYAVRNQDGKWMKSRGQTIGRSWVDDITQAKIYSKPGPAKAQITFWAKNYPRYGIPYLVKITTGICEYLDQEDRVNDAIYKIKKKQLEDSIRNSEYRLNNYVQKTAKDRELVNLEKTILENYKKELKELKK